MELQYTTQKQVVTPQIIFEIINDLLKLEDPLDQDKEHVWAIGLNSKNQIKYIDLIHLGSVNSCPCQPMEIYRRACIKGVASLIVAHNHPSGDPKPSYNDIAGTEKLKQAGETLGITFLDHVIVAKEKYYSFSDAGEL